MNTIRQYLMISLFMGMMSPLLLVGALADADDVAGNVTLRREIGLSAVDRRLFDAIKNNDLQAAELAYGQGANVNATDLENEKKTPLFYAQTPEMVRFLIDRRARVNAEEEFQHTPLFGSPTSEIAELLLDSGADANKQNWKGDNPLFHATTVDVVSVLIDKKADVNARNDRGKTPLFGVTRIDIAKELLERGAQVNVKDKSNQTPLSVACDIYMKSTNAVDENASRQMIDFLLDRDAVIESNTMTMLLKDDLLSGKRRARELFSSKEKDERKKFLVAQLVRAGAEIPYPIDSIKPEMRGIIEKAQKERLWLREEWKDSPEAQAALGEVLPVEGVSNLVEGYLGLPVEMREAMRLQHLEIEPNREGK